MDNTELAKSKVERAYLLYQNFDEISETDVKNIFHCLLNAIELLPTENPDKFELYGQVRNITTRDIKKFGAIFKAMDWKDSFIIRKEDVGRMIQETNNLF